MGAHSVFGPSGAVGWLNCSGKIKAEEGIPDKESSFAAEGSEAHDLVDVALKKNIDVKDLNHESSKEMIDYCQTYVNYVRALGGEQEYEQEVSYDKWVPGGFGTADAIVVKDNTITIVDFKYGKGVKVFAENNPQGMLYALGALNERAVFQDFKEVVIVIHQPRLDHLSEWAILPEKLYAWAEWVKERAALCLEPDAPRTPGEKQCQWCRAKATCPELQTKTEHALMVQFEDMSVKTPLTPQKLTEQDLQFVMHNKSLIESWLKSVESHVKGLIESGHGFPGWKMVAGRSNRKWADDGDAAKTLTTLLGEDAYVKKLLTAPAAEKLLGKEGKKQIQSMIVKPEGKPVLVPEGDKRPALVGITADDFD